MHICRRSLAAIVLGFVLMAVFGLGPGSAADAAPQRMATGSSPPGVRPVAGAVVRPFEAPEHVYGPGHRGVDLRAIPGAPVRAARAGIITWAGLVAGTGYVTVDHGGGLSTTYADLEPSVSAGAWIPAGRRIGHVAQGVTHLDWGARWDRGGNRTYIDPMSLLMDLRPVLVRPKQAAGE